MSTSLKEMSSSELRKLAKKANDMARDLEKEEPSYELAIEHGVRDISYNTVRYGEVASFAGEAFIHMDDGVTWQAIGHRPSGNAHVVTQRGYIEFIPFNR